MTARIAPAPHPTEGWTECRRHADGLSYWRAGERHRSSGWAVDREGVREAWLFGRRLTSPAHDPADALEFAGRDDAGLLCWVDGTGRVRATQRLVAHTGGEETRWFGIDGGPERHHTGGYHRLRRLGTGERRHYEETDGGLRLHRLDGPAVEDAATPQRSAWFEHGRQVDSPTALLNTAKRRMLDGGDEPLQLSAAEHARVARFVAANPDVEEAWELSVAFPDAWIAGALGGAPGGVPGDPFTTAD